MSDKIIAKIIGTLAGSRSGLYATKGSLQEANTFCQEYIGASSPEGLPASVAGAIGIYHNTLIDQIGRMVTETCTEERKHWNPKPLENGDRPRHPRLGAKIWGEEAAAGNTQLGYVDFVNALLELEDIRLKAEEAEARELEELGK